MRYFCQLGIAIMKCERARDNTSTYVYVIRRVRSAETHWYCSHFLSRTFSEF